MSDRHRLPKPSIWPVTLALGVSIAAAGVLTHWLVVLSGTLLTIVAIAAWAADTIRGEA
jgi:hypothetical protein